MTLQAETQAKNVSIEFGPRVSSRFNRIARDRALWGDLVALNWIDDNPRTMLKFQELVDNAVKSFIGDRIMHLVFHGYKDTITKLSNQQIKTIAVRCPNLATLAIYGNGEGHIVNIA